MIRKIRARVLKKYFWLLPLFIMVLVFHSWFLSFGLRTDGDWGFFLKETADTLRRHYFSIWLSDSSFGRVLIDAGQAPTYALYGWLSHYFNTGYAINERLVHMWPTIIMAAVSSYLLTKYILKDKAAGILGMIVYTCNAYYLTLLTGHLTLAAAYAFAPLVILFYFKAITTKRKTDIILSALMLAICAAYEPRMAYILTLTIIMLALFHFLFSFLRDQKVSLRSVCGIGLVYSAPLLIFILLNLYWLFGFLQSGGGTGAAIETSLFGNEFFTLSPALTLFHPFWSGGRIEPFIIHEVPIYFWLVPLAALAGAIVGRRNYKVLFFICLGLTGILLSKQSTEPFSSLYLWLFTHFPGFSAYREASKFYILIALAYSVMLPLLYLYLKYQYKKKWLNISIFTLLAALFLPNLLPIATGKIGATFANRNIPKQYTELNTFLNQDDYYRILWLPQKSRWSLVTATHPEVSASKIISANWKTFGGSIKNVPNATTTDEMNELMKQNYMPELLSKAAVKYIVVPMRDRHNHDDFYRSYNDDPSMFIDTLSKAPYLKEVAKKFDGFRVYETVLPAQPYFSAATDIYAIDNTKKLNAYYELWKQINGQSRNDFNVVVGKHNQVFAGDVKDIFSDIRSSSIQNGTINAELLPRQKQATSYFDAKYKEVSYAVHDSSKNREVIFTHKSLPPSTRSVNTSLNSEESVRLRKDKNYLLKVDEEIIRLDKQRSATLGSPRSDTDLYAIESPNLVPAPKIQQNLWQKEVWDCNDYGGKADIQLQSVIDKAIGKPVISLFAKNHAACTGPGNIPVTAGERYLLHFRYRTFAGQFASYRLTYNNPQQTVVTKDLPLADNIWHTYDQVVVVPAAATEVNIQLIGRPSNQANKHANTLYEGLELFNLSTTATIHTSTGDIQKAAENESVRAYYDKAYTYENLIQNGSLEKGLWQKKVSDCNAYDDSPALRMSLSKKNASEGKQALQLEAKHHIACSGPHRVLVEGGKTYLLEFDYQSPNAKNAGYLLQYGGRKPAQFSEHLPIKGTGWHTFRKVITLPMGVDTLGLSVFAFSDIEAPGKYFINRYDNFILKEIPDIQNRFYQIAPASKQLALPKEITYKNVSATLKKVQVSGASKPFVLRMSEQYHAAWRLQFDNKQSNGAYNYLPHLPAEAVTNNEEHFDLNGFQNGWYIDPDKVCQNQEATCHKNQDGSYDIRLIVQFNAQRWFNFGLILSSITFSGCLIALIYYYQKRRKLPRRLVTKN